MLNRVDTTPKLPPPEDASITTLYVGGLAPVITEDDIRDQFISYGELRYVKKVCRFKTPSIFDLMFEFLSVNCMTALYICAVWLLEQEWPGEARLLV